MYSLTPQSLTTPQTKEHDATSTSEFPRILSILPEPQLQNSSSKSPVTSPGRHPPLSCHYPISAWRTPSGTVVLGKEPADGRHLHLPCGGCLGCRLSQSMAWALRCKLEMQAHRHTTFTTLTYADAPIVLSLRDLQLFIKRLRKNTARPVRYFAVGEYGERNVRPHYHAILYGLGLREAMEIDKAWGLGHTQTVEANEATICYTAGYAQKKIGHKAEPIEYIDHTTGEIIAWVPPFRVMSKRPGIGSNAKQFTSSWRDHAVLNGSKIPVPAFLHKAWKASVDLSEQEDLSYEKYQNSNTEKTQSARLIAAEAILEAKQQAKSERRKL